MAEAPSQESFDLVVVGGGMVGLSLACSLAQTNYSILVIDAAKPPEPFQERSKSGSRLGPKRQGYILRSGFAPRVSAISNRSSRYLTEIQAWGKIAEDLISAYTSMHVWDARGSGEIDLGEASDASDASKSPQGHIVENEILHRALWETASEATNIELIYECPLNELNCKAGAWHLRLHKSEIEAGLVIGADGAQSRVAQYAGLSKREWSYDHLALVAVVETEKSHEQTAWQCFTPLGPLAFLPLNASSPNYSSIVWSINPAAARMLMDFSEKQFAEELTKNFETRLGQVTGVDQRLTFPLVQRHARKYFLPGLALIGDAAHTIHPLAGQGVNLGFSDARTLGKLLKTDDSGKAGDGYVNLLKTYQRRRQPENMAAMALMESFKHLYSSSDPTLNWIRNTGMRFLQGMPSVKKQIIKLAGGGR